MTDHPTHIQQIHDLSDALVRLANAMERYYDPSLPEFDYPFVFSGKVEVGIEFHIESSRQRIYAEISINIPKGKARWHDHRSDFARANRSRAIDIDSAKDWTWINRRVRNLQKEAQR